ncbi:MAG TPA: hypothetical protein VI011_10770 [Asanoa sp.]
MAGETDGGYLQRAELLADLGRDVDAVDELRYPLARDPWAAVALSQLVRYRAVCTILAVLLVGFLDAAHGLLARVLAVVSGTAGVLAVARNVRHGSNSGWVGYSPLAGPAFVLAFGPVSGRWPLVFAILSAARSQPAVLAPARG